MVIFGDFFGSCISSEPRAAGFRPASEIRTKATPCVEVWQTSNLRRLRLGEEKKIGRRKKKPQGTNIMVCPIPVQSRLLERHVIRSFIYPALQQPPDGLLFGEQFGLRPTGSTTAALIALIHTVLTMLSSNAYVRVFALDASKAFNTVRHATLIDKMTKLQMPDQVFNWIKDFLTVTHTVRGTPDKDSPQHSPVYKPVLYKAQV